MITVASEITPAQGITPVTDGGARNADNNGADQSFGDLLGNKIQNRQQAAAKNTSSDNTATDQRQSQSGTAANTTASSSADRATVDRTEQQRQRRLAAGNDSDADANAQALTPASDETTPSVGAGPVTTPAQGSDTQDPALDSNAAQALMALLAQTQQTALANGAANTSAANGGDSNGNATVGQSAGVTTDMTAGGQNPQTAAAASTPAAGADAAAGNAALAAAPVIIPGADKTAGKTLTAQNVPAGMKPATAGIDAGQPAKSHTSDKEPASPADNTASAAANPPGQGPADAGRASDDETDTPVFSLKKTAATVADTQPTQASVTTAATSTLSAAGSNAATTPAPASALISAQLGSDEWQQAIGQQVVMFSRNGQQSAELRLHPENLGSLQISLQMDTNNQMQIHLVSGHSQVRAALEDALPHLRDALAQSGINLGQSSVGSNATPNWGGNGQDARANGRNGEVFSLNVAGSQADNVIAPSSKAATGRTTGIDTFA